MHRICMGVMRRICMLLDGSGYLSSDIPNLETLILEASRLPPSQSLSRNPSSVKLPDPALVFLSLSLSPSLAPVCVTQLQSCIVCRLCINIVLVHCFFLRKRMAATLSSAAQLSGSAVSSPFKFASFEGLTRGRSTRNNNGCFVQQFSSMQHHQAAFIPSLSSYSSRRSSCLTIRAATAVAPTFTTLKPLGDRILLKIQAVEEKSAGGILLPTTAQTKPQGIFRISCIIVSVLLWLKV